MILNLEGQQMILDDIARFNPIYIQMHDNPDADAIASGYGLFCYMSSIPGKVVKLIYSGKNKITKSNLTLMLEYLSNIHFFVHKNTVQ